MKIKNGEDTLDILRRIAPSDDDAKVAELIGEHLLELHHSRYYRLGIGHDVRPSAPRKLEQLQKHFPSYQPPDKMGVCPLPFDWQHKNRVGISTRDRETARNWTVDALLLGYMVIRYWSSKSGGFGRGIADTREYAAEVQDYESKHKPKEVAA